MKAHERSLLAISGQGKGSGKPPQTFGGDTLFAKVSAKSRHNKRQRELYKKHHKAWRAQQAKQAESGAKDREANTAPAAKASQ